MSNAVRAFSCVDRCAVVLASAQAAAQSYPTKPIRFIVASAPGGSADFIARTFAQKITENWRQQAIVDNRAGGNGMIGVQIAAKAAPDGYTVLIAASSTFADRAEPHAEAALRSRQGFHAGDADGGLAEHADRKSFGPGADAGRADPACESEARSDLVRVAGCRVAVAHGGRAPDARGGNQDAARALQGRRTRRERSRRRVRSTCSSEASRPRSRSCAPGNCARLR